MEVSLLTWWQSWMQICLRCHVVKGSLIEHSLGCVFIKLCVLYSISCKKTEDVIITGTFACLLV